MADDSANAAPNDKEESDKTTTPTKITPGSLAQVPYDPDHALNTFLNESGRPETLEERIHRIQALVRGLGTNVGQREE
ncbi:hypothetical protein MKX08_008183 [Trichoderma sp. CBMAI-0020]|nr:hypothetical protein MKX08_008183 [Trichoderma sp. CBMAI-0020]WOD46341.1 hypothetical protein [Trichoderma atroviride]